ncbi:unnamed protein product [Rhizophagus irregularis]|uniref:Uncharacterized protein n=1 Tax=Rhizophagus irregularis TaxID=588596 RepID=A0A916E0D6_9GLOM|nr:unnamed protein product [Rhizophagus irregularis]
MNFLSKQNIFKALPESGDLETAINRAFYFEPVSHVLRKYSSLSLFEEIIARTVEKSVGDSEHFTNLLIEHHEALSTFSVSNLQSLYHFLFIFYESFDFLQVSVSKGWKMLAKNS